MIINLIAFLGAIINCFTFYSVSVISVDESLSLARFTKSTSNLKFRAEIFVFLCFRWTVKFSAHYGVFGGDCELGYGPPSPDRGLKRSDEAWPPSLELGRL